MAAAPTVGARREQGAGPLTAIVFAGQVTGEMQVVGLGWQIYASTGDATRLIWFGLLRSLPVILLAPLGGILADCYDRRRLWLFAQACGAGLNLIAALWGWHEVGGVAAAYIWATLAGALAAVETPARRALLPCLLGPQQLRQAIALNLSAAQLAAALGPLGAGVLLALGAHWAAHALAAAAAATTGAWLFRWRPALPKVRARAPPPFALATVLAALPYLHRQGGLGGWLGLDLATGFLGRALVLLPAVAREVYGIGPALYGALAAAPRLGAVLCSLWQARVAFRASLERRMTLSLVTCAAAMTAAALARHWHVAALCLFVFGGAQALGSIARHTHRQEAVARTMRGRVHGLSLVPIQAAPRLGDAAAGALTGAMAPTHVWLAAGAGFALLGLWQRQGRRRPLPVEVRPRGRRPVATTGSAAVNRGRRRRAPGVGRGQPPL